MRKILAAVMILVGVTSCEAMSLREKVGQLFLIRPDQLDTRIDLEQVHKDKLGTEGITSVNKVMLETLKDYPAGGFVLFRKNIESPSQLRKLTRTLRESCKVLPFMAVDEEGGSIARLANSKGFKLRKYKSAQAMCESGQVREAASYIAS